MKVFQLVSLKSMITVVPFYRAEGPEGLAYALSSNYSMVGTKACRLVAAHLRGQTLFGLDGCESRSINDGEEFIYLLEDKQVYPVMSVSGTQVLNFQFEVGAAPVSIDGLVREATDYCGDLMVWPNGDYHELEPGEDIDYAMSGHSDDYVFSKFTPDHVERDSNFYMVKHVKVSGEEVISHYTLQDFCKFWDSVDLGTVPTHDYQFIAFYHNGRRLKSEDFKTDCNGWTIGIKAVNEGKVLKEDF